jgi:hypothetical protein
MTLPSKPSQIFVLWVISIISAGCATETKPEVPVQSVSIKSDSFCSVMRRLHPPHGIPTWDIAVDSAETVDYARKLEAVVVKKCLPPRKSVKSNQPTS